MFVTLAIHHPRPESVEDFLAFTRRIEDAMQGTPGLLSLETFRDVQEPRLVALGRWESPNAAVAGVGRLMAVEGRQAEWSTRPDDVMQLVPDARPAGR